MFTEQPASSEGVLAGVGGGAPPGQGASALKYTGVCEPEEMTNGNYKCHSPYEPNGCHPALGFLVNTALQRCRSPRGPLSMDPEFQPQNLGLHSLQQLFHRAPSCDKHAESCRRRKDKVPRGREGNACHRGVPRGRGKPRPGHGPPRRLRGWGPLGEPRAGAAGHSSFLGAGEEGLPRPRGRARDPSSNHGASCGSSSPGSSLLAPRPFWVIEMAGDVGLPVSPGVPFVKCQ